MTKKRRRPTLLRQPPPFCTCAVALLFAAGPAAAQGRVSLEVVALTGDAAPDAGTGVFYEGFDAPLLRGDGKVGFRADLEGPGVTVADDSAVFGPDGSGDLVLLVREGDPAGPGSVFRSLDLAKPTDAGIYLVPGTTGFPHDGIWRTVPLGGPDPIARQGLPAPGTGTTFRFLASPALNEAGAAAFIGSFEGRFGASRSGIWRIDPAGALTEVVIEGDPAPGFSTGTFEFFAFPIVLNDAGSIAFGATLDLNLGGAGQADERVLWFQADGGPLQRLTSENTVAPGLDPLGGFLLFGTPRLNALDEVAFTAQVFGSGVTPFNDRGIWGPHAGGPFTLKVREGDAAPGTEPGTVFDDFIEVLLSDAGSVAFLGSLSGPSVVGGNDQGIWLALRDGSLLPLVREGDPVDDQPAGTVIDILSTLLVNEADEILFSAVLAGGGTDSSNNWGAFAIDGAGNIVTLLRKGEVLEVAPGDLRTVETLWFQDDYSSLFGLRSWNDASQAAFRIVFADDSEAIVVATLGPPVAVPLLGPGGLVVLAALLAWAALRPAAPTDRARTLLWRSTT
ncbi:MAG: hypothetical protein QNK03_16370 [Myxococcota bacterium]|nr:hypothetical protein [Myxococcota bacterium]